MLPNDWKWILNIVSLVLVNILFENLPCYIAKIIFFISILSCVPVMVSLKPDMFLLISNTVCIKVSCTVKCVSSMLQEQTIYHKIKRKLIQNILLYNKSTYCNMLIALHRNVASQVSWKITCFILFTGKQDKTTVEESLEAHFLLYLHYSWSTTFCVWSCTSSYIKSI